MATSGTKPSRGGVGYDTDGWVSDRAWDLALGVNGLMEVIRIRCRTPMGLLVWPARQVVTRIVVARRPVHPFFSLKVMVVLLNRATTGL
jgi:hypothetical protein